MDKFDQAIKNARATYQPNPNFVETTMQQITSQPTKRHWGIKLWASILAAGLAAVAIVLVVLPGNSPSKPVSHSGSGISQTAPSTTASLAPGTDDATLSSDLSTINGELAGGNQNLNSTSSALNDQQQEIAVPTD